MEDTFTNREPSGTGASVSSGTAAASVAAASVTTLTAAGACVVSGAVFSPAQPQKLKTEAATRSIAIIFFIKIPPQMTQMPIQYSKSFLALQVFFH
jgi:hypothetical protein